MTKIKRKVDYKIIALGLLIFFSMILFLDLKPGSPNITITAAIAVLMALWWVTEALPIGITSFLPIILFPAFGVMSGKIVSNSYINYVIFLFIGGFIMALAMEKWELHKRIALKILSIVGGSPFKILFGFMFSSAFLSMWMSNTATAMMMLPIAFSVISSFEDIYETEKISKFNTGLLLSIAYACSIGGIATLVGTPPNLSFIRIFSIIFPEAPEIAFSEWLIFALPITIIMFFIALFVLYFLFKPVGKIEKFDKNFFINKYQALGNITTEQHRVFILFLALVFLWVFRKPVNLDFIVIPGWSTFFEVPKYINDGTVAIFIAILLFIVPKKDKSEGLVTWEIMQKIPWSIVFLFGGGFALAKSFVESGLSAYIGEQLMVAGSFSHIGLIATVTSIMSGLTELTSNTATTEMLLPIISGMAVHIGINPLIVMIPITLAASMAFMLPIATPPNAIVFGSGRIRMIDMIKAGIFLNIAGIIIITIVTYFWAVYVFNIDLTQIPDWVGK